MSPKRRHHSPFETSPVPRWLKHFDVQSNEISSRRLEPLKDLRQAFLAEAAQLAAEGWTVEGDGARGATALFFYHRGQERRHCVITPVEQPLQPHSS